MKTPKRLALPTALIALAAACSRAPAQPSASGPSAGKEAAARDKVLIVMSSARQLELRDGKKYTTGYYLDELSHPLEKLLEAGYVPVFANPKGDTPSIDPVSINKMFFHDDEKALAAAQELIASTAGLQHPSTLTTIVEQGTDEYAGIFLPGGHAPMQDLMQNAELGAILRTFHESGRPTAVVCHGPLTLLSALPEPVAYRQALVAGDTAKAREFVAGWPYATYRLTVFTAAEEKMIEGPQGQLGGSVPFYAPDALEQAGAQVEGKEPWQSHVVEDRELVSGQNPFSSEAVGEALVAKLEARRR
jgi:putative intracellular protease/amidase